MFISLLPYVGGCYAQEAYTKMETDTSIVFGFDIVPQH